MHFEEIKYLSNITLHYTNIQVYKNALHFPLDYLKTLLCTLMKHF